MEWISVYERLPAQDIYVLTVRYDGRENVKMQFIQIASRLGKEWIDDNDGEKINPKYGYITHWMPLPDLPKD